MYSSVSVLLVLVAMTSGYAGGASTGVSEHHVHRKIDGDAEYRTIRSASDHSSEDRDHSSEDRDHSSEDRDHSSEDRDQSSEDSDQSSEDRDHSSEDRDQSSEDRDHSSEDRDQSSEDSDHSSEDRDQSSEEATTMAATTEEATTEEGTIMAATTEEATTEEGTTMAATTEEATTEEATTEEATTMAATTEEATAEEATTMAATTEEATTEEATTMAATTEEATTEEATTMAATTEEATTMAATTEEATTMAATTEEATTMAATTEEATTMAATTEEATTMAATTEEATTMAATTEEATTEEATTMAATTEEATTEEAAATTEEATTMAATTEEATTMAATTEEATTMAATTEEATTMAATTEEATTMAVTTEEATTEEATTMAATTEEATTMAATTEEATTEEATTMAATTEEATTMAATTEEATTMAATTEEATTMAATTTAVATTRVSMDTEVTDHVSEILELVKEEDMTTAMQILEEIITRVLLGPPLTLDPEGMLRALAGLLQNTRKLPAVERVKVASEILVCLDRLALLAVNVSFVDIGFIKMNVSEATFEGDLVAMAVNGSSIILVGEELQRLTGATSGKIASFYLTNMTGILDDNDTLSGYSIDGPVLSTAVLCGEEVCNTRTLQSQVKITLRANPDEQEQVCRFWKTDSMRWSGDGCAVDHDQSTHTLTVCTCANPSHIAVLLTPPGEEDTVLVHFDLISYIAVAISLVAMALTVFIHTCFRSLWSPRSYVHVQLCLSLIAYQLVFVTTVDKTHNQVFCSAVAVSLQYLYMAAFMWMLMEGVVLGVGVVKTSRKSKCCTIVTLTIVSYGLPALYLSLALALRHLLTGSWLYTRDARCWLGYGGGFMWVSIAPVLLIVMVSIVAFLVAMATLYRHSKKRAIGYIKSDVYWLKCFAALVVVMSLGWSVATVLQDVFPTPLLQASTLYMAFQGLAIFLMLVLFSDKVRDVFVIRSSRCPDKPSPHLTDPLGVRIDQLMHNTGSQRYMYSKSSIKEQPGPLAFPNPAYSTTHDAMYDSMEKGEDKTTTP